MTLWQVEGKPFGGIMDLNVVGVVLGSISVLQGWQNRPNQSGQFSEINEYINHLCNLDRIFFNAKKIHDGSETFNSITCDSIENLMADKEAIAFNTFKDTYENYCRHLNDMLESKYPGTELATNIIGDWEDIRNGDQNISAEVADSIEKLYIFYPRMCHLRSKIENLRKLIVNEKISANSNRAKLKINITELNDSIGSALYSADKVIYHGAYLMTFLHLQARSSTV